MSIKVTSTVWDHSQHSGSALLVMLAIADFADDAGMAFPGMPTLAKKARTSVRNLHKILEKLVDSGELVIDHKNGIKTRSGQRTNRYLIQLDHLRRGEREDTTLAKKEVNASTPLKNQEVNASTGEEVNASTGAEGQEVNPSSPKPSVNNKPSENPSDKDKDNGSAGASPTAPPVIDCQTDSFNGEKNKAVELLVAAGMHVSVAKKEFATMAVADVRQAIEMADKKEQAGLLTSSKGAYLVGVLRQMRQTQTQKQVQKATDILTSKYKSFYANEV